MLYNSTKKIIKDGEEKRVSKIVPRNAKEVIAIMDAVLNLREEGNITKSDTQILINLMRDEYKKSEDGE